ncbi:MAG: hypothetical protein ACRECE_09415, partial [Xanthobacteraceae bacterium]
MTVRNLPWFEHDNPRDLWRWLFAAGVVVCVHAALVAAYLRFWHPPNEEIGDETSILSIDFTAPQINQVAAAKVDTKPVPPKQTSPDATLPLPKPPPKVEQNSPAPRTTVRELARA